MSFALPLKVATSSSARNAVSKAIAPKRLGPNPLLVQAKRVIPTIGGWSVLMFTFLSWPLAFKYGIEKTTGV